VQRTRDQTVNVVDYARDQIFDDLDRQVDTDTDTDTTQATRKG